MYDVIGIPQGTRLQSIVLHHNGDVQLWIAVKSMRGPASEWQGTYILIKPDGSITRVTRDDAYTVDDVFEIKGPTQHTYNWKEIKCTITSNLPEHRKYSTP